MKSPGSGDNNTVCCNMLFSWVTVVGGVGSGAVTGSARTTAALTPLGFELTSSYHTVFGGGSKLLQCSPESQPINT